MKTPLIGTRCRTSIWVWGWVGGGSLSRLATLCSTCKWTWRACLGALAGKGSSSMCLTKEHPPSGKVVLPHQVHSSGRDAPRTVKRGTLSTPDQWVDMS